jgi:glycosyltransferase involved in cell wall biosynthesis
MIDKDKKILYLYRELMPYNIQVLKSLIRKGYKVLFVHDEKNKLTPFEAPFVDGVEFISLLKFDFNSLESLVRNFNPNIIFISDRTKPIYNKIGVLYSSKIPVISGIDSQWRGGRQWLNVSTSFFRHKRFFSHVLVAGLRQFEYAKKLGFSNSKIIWPLYSADTNSFEKMPLSLERFESAKDILFVGRFNKVKGIKFLLDAWAKLNCKNGSKLHLVGNGNYLDNFILPDDVIVHPFKDQKYLAELAYTCKAFILPSIFEPWGVVIHEFSAAGMPLIITNVCGASPHFLINNHNGFSIDSASSDEILLALNKIFKSSASDLLEMGIKSRELSRTINPDMVASAILSTIK